MRTRKRTGKLAAVVAATSLLFLAGCYSAPIMPPGGIIWSGIEAPASITAVGQDVGMRKGQSSSSALLGLFAWGDASVHAAARNGGISKLKHIDYRYTNFLLIWQSFTTVMYGE